MIFLRSEMMKRVPFHCARHHTLKTTNRCAHRPRAEWPVARLLKKSTPLGMTKVKLKGSSGGFFFKFENDGQENCPKESPNSFACCTPSSKPMPRASVRSAAW